MHAEICPICSGKGEIPVNYPCWCPSKETKPCHGCGGKGWIQVSDEYRYINPYIWIDPQPYKWDDMDGTTGSTNDNVIISFEFSKKKK